MLLKDAQSHVKSSLSLCPYYAVIDFHNDDNNNHHAYALALFRETEEALAYIKSKFLMLQSAEEIENFNLTVIRIN